MNWSLQLQRDKSTLRPQTTLYCYCSCGCNWRHLQWIKGFWLVTQPSGSVNNAGYGTRSASGTPRLHSKQPWKIPANNARRYIKSVPSKRVQISRATNVDTPAYSQTYQRSHTSRSRDRLSKISTNFQSDLFTQNGAATLYICSVLRWSWPTWKPALHDVSCQWCNHSHSHHSGWHEHWILKKLKTRWWRFWCGV